MLQPQSLRTLQISTALVYCLFSVGICFGFAALKPILIESGVYENKCFGTTDPFSVQATKGLARCVKQELALNQMFTWAAVGTNVSAFPIGLILDQYGPRIASIIGTVLMFFGSFGLSLASDIFDIYIPSYCILAIAGSFLLLSSFSLASLVPSKAGLVVSGMTGAFDASSGLFLIYRLVFEKLGAPSIKTFFTVYLVVPIAILIAQVWYMPRRICKDKVSIVDTQESSVVQATETTNLLSATDESRVYTHGDGLVDPVDGIMHQASVGSVLVSGWFLWPALVMIASLIRVNFYIATVHAQLIFFIGKADAGIVMNLFDILLPIGGILAIPLIGWIIDTYTTSTVYFLTLMLSLASGLLSFVPNTYAQILHVLSFVVLRPWIYSILPGTVTRLFGNDRFGAFYGLIMAIAGLVNLLAHDLEVVTYDFFKGSFVPVNIGLVGTSVTTLVVTVMYMKVKISQVS